MAGQINKPFFFWERGGENRFTLYRACGGNTVPIKELMKEAEIIAECKRLRELPEDEEFAEYLRLGMAVISERLWRKNG